MQPLKAHVKNGRLTLDEPTDLPEGQVVYLQLIDGIVGNDDEVDEDDRPALHAELVFFRFQIRPVNSPPSSLRRLL